VMNQPPRRLDEPIINSQIKKWMISIFAINGVITFLFFFFAYNLTSDIDRTRTLVFTLMAFDSLAFAYSIRSFNRSVFHRSIFSNKFLNWAVAISFVLLLGAIYMPVLQGFLGTTSLGLGEWVIILLITILEIEAIEAFKALFLKKRTDKSFNNSFFWRKTVN